MNPKHFIWTKWSIVFFVLLTILLSIESSKIMLTKNVDNYSDADIGDDYDDDVDDVNEMKKIDEKNDNNKPLSSSINIQHIGSPDQLLSSQAISTTTTINPRLPTPKNIRLICRRHMAHLSWPYNKQPDYISNVDNPVHFIVYKRFNDQYSNMDENGESEWEKLDFIEPIRRNQLNVQPIYPSSSYSFKIQAIWKNNKGITITSENSTIETCRSKNDVPIRNPIILSAYRCAESNTTTVVWEPLQRYEYGGPDFRYKIIAIAANNSSKTIGPFYTNDTTLAIENLDTSIEWLVNVQSRNQYGESYDKPQKFLANLPESMPIAWPENLNATVIDGDTVRFEWKPVPIKYVKGNFKGLNIYKIFTLLTFEFTFIIHNCRLYIANKIDK